MGHKFSKNQRTLPTPIIQSKSREEIAIEGGDGDHQPTLPAAVCQKPKSIVITICMLKMEPSDMNQLNNLNQITKCSCSTLSTSNYSQQQHQQQQENNICQHQLRMENCFHCNCMYNNSSHQASTTNRQPCSHCRIGNRNPAANFNINVFDDSIAVRCRNNLVDNDDDNSNVLIDRQTTTTTTTTTMTNNNLSNNFNCDNNILGHISSLSSSAATSFSHGRDATANCEIKMNNCSSQDTNRFDLHQSRVPPIQQRNTFENVLNNNHLSIGHANRGFGAVPAAAIYDKDADDIEPIRECVSVIRIDVGGQTDDDQFDQLPSTSTWNRCCNLCSICKNNEDTNSRINWGLKYNADRPKSTTEGMKMHPISNFAINDLPILTNETDPCVCTSYKRVDDDNDGRIGAAVNTASASFDAVASVSSISSVPTTGESSSFNTPSVASSYDNADNANIILFPSRQLLDFSKFNPEEYPIEDCDEKARIQRALEIAEGVEPPPGFQPSASVTPAAGIVPPPSNDGNGSETVAAAAAAAVDAPVVPIIQQQSVPSPNPQQWHMVCSNDSALQIVLQTLLQRPGEIPRLVHSQVDYIHCLVPDLKKITNSCFYWGKMDRYEAERLLEGKPEGTFLLRDSAQEEFLFSVSFRKYGRSLHARIEQFNHKFSFDCHDPGVYTSTTVTGLLEHYKDPACVMFFEPQLTLPLNRKFCFSLQQLCRATIVSHTTYDGINDLSLPATLKSYLKEYHYKQRVRINRFDEPVYSIS